MNDLNFAVTVVGGGPVGWACALAAQNALGKRVRVAVVERDPAAAEPIASAAPLDARVYTVAAGNLGWLAAQGVAFDRNRTAAVTKIVVCGRDGRESLRISADDAGQPELAAVLEHNALTRAISNRAVAVGVQSIHGSCLALHDAGEQKLIELADGRVLQTGLVIAADGVQSRLREMSEITATVRAYPQVGLVAHLHSRQSHRGAARQWFLADGSVLALLPLPDMSGSPAVSMVWSLTADRAAELCAMDESAFVDAVNAASLHAQDLRALASPRQQFPLTLVRATNPVAQRLLMVGDAAHSVHPLAGQGVNLGLVDARALQTVWDEVSRVGNDPGHPLLLGRYRRARFGPTLAMQLATDGLFRLYNQVDHPLLMAAGDAGMRLFSRLPAFRRTLSTAALQ